MKIKIKNGIEIEIESIDKCRGIKKFIGLMFKSRRANAKLFEFNISRQAIHSLFCPPFLAMWLDKNNRVLEHKFVRRARLSIRPKQKFSKLLEVPINKKYKEIIEEFK